MIIMIIVMIMFTMTRRGIYVALVLQDLDITSKVEANGWRKVNTITLIIVVVIVVVVIVIIVIIITIIIIIMQVNSLAHYGVKEKALVSLVPKQIDSPSHHIYQVRLVCISIYQVRVIIIQ